MPFQGRVLRITKDDGLPVKNGGLVAQRDPLDLDNWLDQSGQINEFMHQSDSDFHRPPPQAPPASPNPRVTRMCAGIVTSNVLTVTILPWQNFAFSQNSPLTEWTSKKFARSSTS